MSKVYIIIVNWNGWQDTKECLNSLNKIQNNSYDIEVVIVDNGSYKDISSSLSVQKNQLKNIDIHAIFNKSNLGFAGGNNKGISYALKKGANYILLLNNDTVVDENFLDSLISFLSTHENVGIVGPKIFFYKGYEYHNKRYNKIEKGKVLWYAGGIIDWENMYASHRGVDEVDIGRYSKIEQTDFVTGCAMMVKREVFEKIGKLDENYFMYLEDVDFCVRARNAGYTIWYIPQSRIWHKNAQSSGKPGSKLHVYYQTRNRLIFGYRYGKLSTKIHLLIQSIEEYSRGDEIKKQAILDYYLKKWGKKE